MEWKVENRPAEFAAGEKLSRTLEHLKALAHRQDITIDICDIGSSREGRPLYGITAGKGVLRASVTAGAHSDEPLGPMTALRLVEWALATEEGRDLLRSVRLVICPDVNPDGSEKNRAWFADPPDPLVYFRNVFREGPGDDVEFGYPDPRTGMNSAARAQVRPENKAVARFLEAAGPAVFHASLHGMALAEGAWFLVGSTWVSRTAQLRERLARASFECGLPLHDIDRHGEKGFFRIGPGFSTTPTSAGMRDFFLAQDDAATASLFRLNSMEFASALGGDPLVMVSELPLFLIGNRTVQSCTYEPNLPAPESPTGYERFRFALKDAAIQAHGGNTAPLKQLAESHSLHPVPLSVQIYLQGLMVIEGIRTALGAAQSTGMGVSPPEGQRSTQVQRP